MVFVANVATSIPISPGIRVGATSPLSVLETEPLVVCDNYSSITNHVVLTVVPDNALLVARPSDMLNCLIPS